MQSSGESFPIIWVWLSLRDPLSWHDWPSSTNCKPAQDVLTEVAHRRHPRHVRFILSIALYPLLCLGSDSGIHQVQAYGR